jgi:hypothetical protein
MKRIVFSLVLSLAFGTAAFNARAGGWHGGGGGWHGGGCWGGGWHGGYCGYGHGWYGGYWPTFSFGIGFGYPAYGGYYGYPAYGYAYAPAVYPTYVYRPYAPTVSVAVAAAPTTRPAATTLIYAYSKPAASSVGQQPYTTSSRKTSNVPPSPAKPALAPAKASSGTWVLDREPYSYTPATTPTPANPHGTGPSAYVVTR